MVSGCWETFQNGCNKPCERPGRHRGQPYYRWALVCYPQRLAALIPHHIPQSASGFRDRFRTDVARGKGSQAMSSELAPCELSVALSIVSSYRVSPFSSDGACASARASADEETIHSRTLVGDLDLLRWLAARCSSCR